MFIIFDFDDFLENGSLPSCDHIYICLGTTIKKAGSQSEFKKVDFDYCVSFAKKAREAGTTKISLVSSVGANPYVKNFYLKTKGEVEEEIKKIEPTIKTEALETKIEQENPERFNEEPNIFEENKDEIDKVLEFAKNNEKSGFVSSGSTAAIMVLSRLHMGMIDGIDRPAICSLVPNKKNYSLMLDLGANVIVSGANLFQFALMGFCYYSIINNNIKPKIGILNIGTENNKGLEFLQEAADLILSSFLKEHFIGFIEPNKITSGDCDIIVSGFLELLALALSTAHAFWFGLIV